MRGLQIEVVAGAIEINGDDDGALHAVFTSIGIKHNEERFFGDAIGGVGFFGVAVPDVGFFEGDGGEFGVSANGADLDELFEAANSGLFDEVESHRHVGEEESSGVEPVGTNAADFCSQVEDDIGLKVVIEANDVCFAGQVVGGFAGDMDFGASAIAELLADDSSKETGSTSHDNGEFRPGGQRTGHFRVSLFR